MNDEEKIDDFTWMMGNLMRHELPESEQKIIADLYMLTQRFRNIFVRHVIAKFGSRDVDKKAFFKFVREQDDFIKGLQLKSGTLMAKLPVEFVSMKNPGGGECVFHAVGQIFNMTNTDIRHAVAGGIDAYVKSFFRTKKADFGFENELDAWNFIREHLLPGSERERKLILPKKTQKDFAQLLMKPRILWGANIYLEMMLMNPDFRRGKNLNLMILDLTWSVPVPGGNGNMRLPGLHCFSRSDEIPCEWILMLRTTTNGYSSGGKHYEMLKIKGCTDRVYGVEILETALSSAGYGKIQVEHEQFVECIKNLNNCGGYLD
jgi:hypothetical protein